MYFRRLIYLVEGVLVLITFSVFGQSNQVNTQRPPDIQRRRLQQWSSITASYREKAVNLMIEEANGIVRELHLVEKVPLTKVDLLENYVSPPSLTARVPAFGNITTSNYVYFFTVGRKFSFLERTDLEKERDYCKKKYIWPTSRIDTNAAYQAATQLLFAASMDVASLNRECAAYIELPLLDQASDTFVPLYWIYWMKPGVVGSRTEIELCLPTKTLLQMHVMESKYILRRPLEITDAEVPLSQINSPVLTNAAPPTH